MKLKLSLLSTAGICSSLSLSAFTTYLNRTDWENALSGTATTETFDANIADADSITFASGIQSVGINLNPGGTGNNEVSGGEWSGDVRNSGSANFGYTSITWTFSSPINAFAADFSSIAGSRALELLGNWDGGGEVGINLRDTVGPGGFLGVIGTSTFTQIRFDINEGTATIVGNDLFGADNVSFAVPEPSTAGLIAGALALGFVATRRKR